MWLFLLTGSVMSALFFVAFALYGQQKWLLEWSILLGSMNYMFIGLMFRSFRLDLSVPQLRQGSAVALLLMVLWTWSCFHSTEAMSVAASFGLGQLMLGWFCWELYQYARIWPSWSAKSMAALVALQFVDNFFRTWMVLIGNTTWSLLLHWMLLLLGLLVMLLLFGVLQMRKAQQEQHLVNSLAHELRQPLGAMRLKLEHLIHDGSEMSPTDAHDLLHQLISENDRATAIIQGLRRFFDLSQMQRQPMDLSAMLQAMRLRLQPDLASQGIALEAQLEDGVQVLGDAAQLDMVVYNLLLNAREALQEQEGRVGCKIGLSLRTEARQAVLCVTDNGPGVALADAARIFEIHFTRKAKGMGLGLWLCRTVVQEHGGKLSLMPSVQGAQFVITLPLLGSTSER
ncbi:HAMP domain-containing sensor histidine kinase [Limnohabitans sp.]|uniref:sensor histidine kinase n=1 Tax=Limnohabitans sp. TaxID=1907725 RepID=UPI0025C5122A|nr:HAMP domain-containing sensor histidine kinase [Limnohabitans sp.]